MLSAYILVLVAWLQVTETPQFYAFTLDHNLTLEDCLAERQADPPDLVTQFEYCLPTGAPVLTDDGKPFIPANQ